VRTLHAHHCYDKAGDLVATVPPSAAKADVNCGALSASDKATRMTYDKAHRLLSEQPPGKAATSVSYDDNGNVASATDQANITTTFSYDQSSRDSSDGSRASDAARMDMRSRICAKISGQRAMVATKRRSRTATLVGSQTFTLSAAGTKDSSSASLHARAMSPGPSSSTPVRSTTSVRQMIKPWSNRNPRSLGPRRTSGGRQSPQSSSITRATAAS
jgi:YD repeat-containing protein